MDAQPDPGSILLIDDDLDLLSTLAEQLRWEGYKVTPCPSAPEGLARLREASFAAIISDQNMPGMTGLEFFAQARELQPNASRILITGVLALDTVVGAINQGEIFRFLAKPWSRAELLATVENAVQRYRLLTDNVRLRADTMKLNRQLAAANAELLEKLEQLTAQKQQLDAAHEALNTNFEHSLELCYRIMNTFYPLLGARTKAVVELCRKMAATDDLSFEDRRVLATSAWLHDIGLIGVKREVLHKVFHHPKDCQPEDWTLIQQHPVYGQTLAGFIDSLDAVGATIRAHHERFDGRGYPDRLAGEMIPWTARLLAVAAAYVETGLSPAQATQHLVKESGSAFDPEAVRLFCKATQTAELPRTVTEVRVADLKPGMALADGIFSPSGLLLIPEGQKLNETTIAKIRKHNLLNHVTQRLLVYS
jgi:response regulator RpfG family c-di-GMP phosphodiesterase